MKKYLFYFSAIAAVALCNISCSSSDDDDDPIITPSVVLEEPATANEAVAYTIPEASQPQSATGENYLEGVNITESGKTVLKVNTAQGVKYVTFDTTIKKEGNKTIYTLTKDGKQAGTIVKVDAAASRTRGTSVGDLIIDLVFEIPGVEGTVTFTSTVSDAQEVNEIASSVNLTNIARTWKVQEMSMSLKGDVDCTVLEKSNNLMPLAEKAQENDAQLTEDEYRELCKTIVGITLDKTGLFSIEYKNASGKIKYYYTKADADKGNFKYIECDGKTDSEACKWSWANANTQDVLKISSEKDTDFGNKFLNDDSRIGVKFYENGIAHFTITTKITGNKNYDATIDFTVKSSN